MSVRRSLESLRPCLPCIAPSMLKCDFGDLARELRLLEQGEARLLHWDVMDGRFVPNLSYGALVIERLRDRTDLPFDAHLMIAEPGRWVRDYIRAGCQGVTIHLEAVDDPRPVLDDIRSSGCTAGLALNPATPARRLEGLVDHCDLILVMSVEPGFGGQSFMPGAVKKLEEVRRIAGPRTIVSVDGGIGLDTIAQCSAAGADLFVAGSAVFDRPDYGAALAELSARALASRAGA